MTNTDYQTQLAAFLQAYPDYATTAQLDTLRETEYSRLDAKQQIYLDYTGGGLYAQSQIEQHVAMLSEGVWGNPHSQNPTSLAMTELVEQARAYVLAYFRADPDEYDVIFTANASGALKLVGESFPFQAGGRYVLLADNHNSVNGIREFARARGADVQYVPTVPPQMYLDETALLRQLDTINTAYANLFAFPAQSNYTGVKHPLTWIAEAQARGWSVLLDAAAFAPTNRLDLSQHKPDFVSLSFYKIFGYPTGLGCLIARKPALGQLVRPWFAGGTITIASTQRMNWHYLIDGHAAFEDGTVNYLNIPAVEIGLRYMDSIGVETITRRVRILTDWLLCEMQRLKHHNGRSLVDVHGPLDTAQRGGTITFNLDDADGRRFDYRHVEQCANRARISLRTGCFCNPGSGEIAHNLLETEMGRAFSLEKVPNFDQLYEMAAHEFNKHPSAIRVSVGIATNFADVFHLVQFLQTFLNTSAAEAGCTPARTSSQPDTA